jgi:vitamin B12 transporter
MKKEKLFIVVSATLFFVQHLSAQDSLKQKDLSEVVVTATRSEKNQNDIGRSITVITADDIKKSGANSLAEVLSKQGGMYLVGAGQNPGMTTSIFTRGSNSNQTVILIDGVRITDPSAINNAIDMAELSTLNIDRIEIVRGSHSTMYGSSAIGGVINIITKKNNKSGLSADASVTAGTFGEKTSDLSENVYLNYALKNGVYVGAEVLNRNVKGLNATVDTVTNPAVHKHNNMQDGFNKIDWVAKAGYRKEKTDIYFSFKQSKQLTDIDKSAYRDDDNYTLDFKRNLMNYGASYKINENIKLSYIGGYSLMKRVAIDDSSTIDAAGTFDKTYNKGIYEGKLSTNELQANYNRKGINLVIGGGLYSEQMKINTSYLYYNAWGFPPAYAEIKNSLDSVNPKATIANVFLHTDIGGELISENFKWLNIAGGFRYSNHSVVGSNVVYEINPSVKIKDAGLLFASYATGFNAPSLYQLYEPSKYVTWDMAYTTGLTRGNKKLSPETSKTFEIGYKQTINKTTLSFAYFNTVIENAIEYVYLWDKNIGIDTLGQNWGRDDYRGDTYLNLGTITTQGIEISVQSQLSDKFLVAANVSLVSGKLSYKPSDIDTSQTGGNHVQVYSNGAFVNKNIETLGLVRRPNTGNISITYLPIKKIALRADIRYVGSRADIYYESALGPYGALATVGVEQYTLFDVSLNAKIYKGLSAMLKVENVLDKKYYEINGFTTRGRGLYFTLRYAL